MIKYIVIGAIILVIGIYWFVPVQQTSGAFGDPFISIQLAPSPSNGNCLTTDGTDNAWGACGGGGGASSDFDYVINSTLNTYLTPTTTYTGILTTSSSTF